MNSTKPRMRKSKVVRKNRSDMSRTITVPVSFDLVNSLRAGLDSQCNWDFDVLSLLAKSNVFKSLSQAYDRFRIKRVRGCIDVNNVSDLYLRKDKIYGFYQAGTDYAVQGKYNVDGEPRDLSSRFKNPVLFCAFDRRNTVMDVVDPSTYGSCIFQAMLPGTKIHLSPDVSASTLQERMGFIPTNVLSRYRNFVVKQSNQIVFDPTFHIEFKHELSGGPILASEFPLNTFLIQAGRPLTASDVLTFVTIVKLHCLFYVDLVFDGIRDVVDEDVSDQQLFAVKVDGVPFIIKQYLPTEQPISVQQGAYKAWFGGTAPLDSNVVCLYKRPHGIAAVYTTFSGELPPPDAVMWFTNWYNASYHPEISFSVAGVDEEFKLDFQTFISADKLDYKELPEYYLDVVSGYLN